MSRRSRYEFDDEIEEDVDMLEGDEEDWDEDEDFEDEDFDDEDEDEDFDDEEDMEESRASGRRRRLRTEDADLDTKTLLEQNQRLMHSADRAARYITLHSALVNSGLNESQMMSVIDRMDNPWNYTQEQWADYCEQAVDQYRRGDRTGRVFEHIDRTTGRASSSARSLHESAAHKAEHHDPVTANTLAVLRRMQNKG